MTKKHKVQFNAHRVVKEEVPVRFKTRDGERVPKDSTVEAHHQCHQP